MAELDNMQNPHCLHMFIVMNMQKVDIAPAGCIIISSWGLRIHIAMSVDETNTSWTVGRLTEALSVDGQTPVAAGEMRLISHGQHLD